VVRRVGIALVLFIVIITAHPGAAKERRLGAAVAPLRLIPNDRDLTSVAGLHRFYGRVEVDSAADGLVISNRLPLERYLFGLNEVPLAWPTEALRAQAVAARTYALWTLSQPRDGAAALYGFDICASVECQVFSGADVVSVPGGFRWAAAVRSTANQAILYGGAPILARYHSTSGGMTFDNRQVFTDEPDYPYLQSVPSTSETASPLYRWKTEFTLRRLQRVLRRAGWWPESNGRLRIVKTIPSRFDRHYPDVVVRGPRSVVVRSVEELRDVVRDLAPALFPALYPSRAATASGRLPETFPSNRVRIATRRGRVIVVGRGWGHGVGMSQWGAFGLALDGAAYPEILAHYYTGTSVQEVNPPESIEVGVGWGRGEVVASGSFSIVDGRGRTLVRNALGSWRFKFSGEGTVGIDPPQGFGLPLRVAIVNAPPEVGVGEVVPITIALSRPARVTTVTAPSEGLPEATDRIKRAGRNRVAWFAPVSAGTYRVRVTASAGPLARRSEPVAIRVLEEEEPTQATDADENIPTGPPWFTIGAGILLFALAVGALTGTIRGR